VSFEAVTSSSPYSNLYYSVELPGVFKSISLTSYSPDQEKNGFGSADEQYKWLQQELAKVRPGHMRRHVIKQGCSDHCCFVGCKQVTG
jgi:hypothetical protein